MSTMSAIVVTMMLLVAFSHQYKTEPLQEIDYASSNRNNHNLNNDQNSGNDLIENDALITCEDSLRKYRKSLSQAIVIFEDVCDINEVEPGLLNDELETSQIVRSYKTTAWAFLKLFMAQFNDDDQFVNDLRNAVIERCRIKLQQQHDMKRNTAVLGKKQRFHSWGGKRSGGRPTAAAANDEIEAFSKGLNKHSSNIFKNVFPL